MSVEIIRGNALDLPLQDGTVDLVVTSPPYFGLRSYQDGGEHYSGQLGDEATPEQFVDGLIAATAEMVRVLKPSGSIFVNLGDKYAGSNTVGRNDSDTRNAWQHKTGQANKPHRANDGGRAQARKFTGNYGGIPSKSLLGLPWRYALRCMDELGLILRAELVWSKPNGLPESVTDRVRRSHEQWFHFTVGPKYYANVDTIREAHTTPGVGGPRRHAGAAFLSVGKHSSADGSGHLDGNPLGKLPGSVWSVPSQPLRLPPELGVDHFAAFPMAWPRRLIQGWCPPGVCTVCGEGRRAATAMERRNAGGALARATLGRVSGTTAPNGRTGARKALSVAITGEACGCEAPDAPTTPGVVLDPFGGTGTTATVAHALGRHGVSVDLSDDYCRVARWRTSDPVQLARAAGTTPPKRAPKPARMEGLW